MRSCWMSGICCSFLILGACQAEVSPNVSPASVPSALAEPVNSDSLGGSATVTAESPEEPALAAAKKPDSEPRRSCDDNDNAAKPVMIDGQEAVEYSIKYRGGKKPIYAFKDIHVICFRQQPMPKSIAAVLGDLVKPVDAEWSRGLLDNRSCLVVAASDADWKAQSERLNELRVDGSVWALGQVVKFDQKPKSSVYVILDRVGFDLEPGKGMGNLLATSKELGFSITKSDSPTKSRSRVPKYLAIPNSELSALELVSILEHSNQVAKVQPTYVSPLQTR